MKHKPSPNDLLFSNEGQCTCFELPKPGVGEIIVGTMSEEAEELYLQKMESFKKLRSAAVLIHKKERLFEILKRYTGHSKTLQRHHDGMIETIFRDIYEPTKTEWLASSDRFWHKIGEEFPQHQNENLGVREGHKIVLIRNVSFLEWMTGKIYGIFGCFTNKKIQETTAS